MSESHDKQENDEESMVKSQCVIIFDWTVCLVGSAIHSLNF